MSIPAYFSVGTLFFAVTLCAQDVSTPSKRMEALDTARELLTPRPITESAEQIEHLNPFLNSKNQTNNLVTVAVSDQISDRELLLNLSKNITATGTMQLGGKSILLIGQKNFKIGDEISIFFQGTNYDLKIIKIDRTSFTLRLNSEEITRPIKP